MQWTENRQFQRIFCSQLKEVPTSFLSFRFKMDAWILGVVIVYLSLYEVEAEIKSCELHPFLSCKWNKLWLLHNPEISLHIQLSNCNSLSLLMYASSSNVITTCPVETITFTVCMNYLMTNSIEVGKLSINILENILMRLLKIKLIYCYLFTSLT